MESGKAKAIGVSNFNIQRLKELLASAKIKPVVNQVELHPFLPQYELKAFCDAQNIHLTAYSPLGSTDAPLANDPIIKEIAAKYKKSEPQVLISWAGQRGTSVLPKSVHKERIIANFQDFILEDEDFKRISQITIVDSSKIKRVCDPAKFWNKPCFETE